MSSGLPEPSGEPSAEPARPGAVWSRRLLLGAALAVASGAVARAWWDPDDDGGGQTGSGGATPCPERPGTRYGVNATTAAEVSTRLAEFGAVGITRVFYPGMLPTRWDPTREGASPDRATQVSFKATPAAVAAGEHDVVLRSWLATVPTGWQVYLTFWHEPNDELRRGVFSAGDFRAAWSRLSAISADVTYQPAVRMSLVPVFMGYLLDTPGGWSDDWAPRPDEVALLSWDVYGNPAGGDGLSGDYPDPEQRLDPSLEITARLGFTTWAVSEFDTPRRVWDAGEVARTAWLEQFHRYAVGCGRTVEPALGPPEFMLLWEGEGANWDQRFSTATTRDWWRGIVDGSVGG